MNEELERYRQALCDIIDPLAYMTRTMGHGYKLDPGAALKACENPETYKDIARRALRL